MGGRAGGGALTYETATAHVIKVLTGRASNSYKAFLRKLGISYLIAGEKTWIMPWCWKS